MAVRTREPGDLTPQCDGCSRNLFREARLGPELHDATWLKLAGKHAVLCSECMFQRAAECGVALTLADLKPCLANVARSPNSWYELFLSRENDPPPHLRDEFDSMLNEVKQKISQSRSRQRPPR
jgi:hypothetical protein